ncbi:hypothetical protein ACUBH3_23540, partial [Pseudomonas capsici]
MKKPLKSGFFIAQHPPRTNNDQKIQRCTTISATSVRRLAPGCCSACLRRRWPGWAQPLLSSIEAFLRPPKKSQPNGARPMKRRSLIKAFTLTASIAAMGMTWTVQA